MEGEGTDLETIITDMVKDRLNEWVKEEYDWIVRQITKNIAKGGMSEYALDLAHHIILDLYNMDEDKIAGMLDNGKLKWYVLSGAGLQLRSGTSPFYRTHRKLKMSARSGVIESDADNPYYNEGYEMEDFDGEETLSDCLEKAVNQLDWYLKALWDKKFNSNWTLQEIYEHYNIGKVHLIKDLNKAIAEVREICK